MLSPMPPPTTSVGWLFWRSQGTGCFSGRLRSYPNPTGRTSRDCCDTANVRRCAEEFQCLTTGKLKRFFVSCLPTSVRKTRPCKRKGSAMSLHETSDTQQVVVDRALVEVAKAKRNGISINVREVAETILRQHTDAARSIANSLIRSRGRRLKPECRSSSNGSDVRRRGL